MREDPDRASPKPPGRQGDSDIQWPPSSLAAPLLSARRRLFRPLGLIAALALLIALGLVFLFGTTSGLRWGLAIAERLLPLSVAQAEGRLADRLRLGDLVLRPPGLELRLKGLDLGWRPAALLKGRLVIAHLRLQGLEVRLSRSNQGDPADGLPEFILPLPIELVELALDGLRVYQGDRPEPLFALDGAQLSGGSLKGDILSLGRLEAWLRPDLRLGLRGQARLSGDYPLTAELDWALALKPEGLTGMGRLEGDLKRLRLSQTLRGAVAAQLEVEISDLSIDPSWDARAQIEGVGLKTLAVGPGPLALRGELTSVGRLRDARLEGRFELKAPWWPGGAPLLMQLAAQWQIDRVLIQTLELNAPETASRIEAGGELDLKRSPLGFRLDGKWQGLYWPLRDRLIARSRSGAFSAHGNLEAFSYQLSGRLAGPNTPEAAIELQGQGSLRDTRIEVLSIRLLEGWLRGRGSVDWSTALSWDLDLEATDLNPAVQLPDWPGRLSGRLRTQGQTQHWSVVLEDVQGKLRGYPVAAAGQLEIQPNGEVEVKGLILSSGTNRLRLSGQVGRSLDLVLELDAPDLAGLWPGAAGQLGLSGRLKGDPRAPRLRLDLKGQGMRLGGRGLAALGGAIDLDLEPPGQLLVQLRGQDLRCGNLVWRSLELSSRGQLSGHRLQARFQGRPLSLLLEGEGTMADGGVYSAQVKRLDLDHESFGHWSLQRPLTLSRAGTGLKIGPVCLRESGGSTGCLGFEQQAPGHWGLELDGRLDLAAFKGPWPGNLNAGGMVRLRGQLKAEGDLFAGELGAEIPRGRLSLDLGGGQLETVELAASQLRLRADRAGLDASLDLPLAQAGRLQAELALPGWRPGRPPPSLRGRLLAELKASPLAALVPQLSDLQGSLHADLDLRGTPDRPVISGQAWLRDIRFQVPRLGLRLEDLDLEAKAAQGGQLELWGQARLGGGLLRLSGQGRATPGQPQVHLGISGERLKLLDTKEYLIYVEPRLGLELHPAGALLQGELHIPEARIRPRPSPPGAVSPSRDVVLLHEQGRSPFPLQLDVRLRLGDKVSMDGFGLRGRLGGDLRLLKEPGRELVGDGQIQIIDGQYRLTRRLGIAAEVGAPLSITQGRLVYAKSPLGNPGLWIQAERHGGDLTAGVRVIGTLREPKLTFFSETDPGLTQSDITKYLMTGVPPAANDRLEGPGLAIGTYLAPELYMEYEGGLGGDSNRLKLRYDLSKHIEFQAETGAKQGADIFFRFEH